MLSYALAIAVAISSLALFTTAFLMSDIHRQDDFLWSGVGLFYALILWFCARNITGAVLLGQAAATTLLVSYSWQTLKLRKALAHPERATEINNFSILRSANKLLKRDRPAAPAAVESSTTLKDKVTAEIAIPDVPTKSTVAKPEKSSRLGRFFGKKKSTITNTKLDEILEDEPVDKPKAKPTSQPTSSPEVVTPPVVPTSSETTPKVTQPATPTPETKLESAKVSPDPTKQTEKKPAIKKDPEVAKPEQPPVAIAEVKVEAEAVKPQAKQPDVAIEKQIAKNTEVKKSEPEQPPVTIKEVEQGQKTPITQPVEANIPAVETTIAEQPPQASKTKPEEILPEETNSQPKAETQPALDKIEELPQPEIKPAAGDRQNQESEKSALDALETVEVAEVLDAVPDENHGDYTAGRLRDRDLDRANIIEVTTTDISITTEVKQIDSEDQNTQDN